MVASVVGVGGLGKTTIANYNKRRLGNSPRAALGAPASFHVARGPYPRRPRVPAAALGTFEGSIGHAPEFFYHHEKMRVCNKVRKKTDGINAHV